MPVEEAETLLSYAKAQGLAFIPLAAPTSGDQRLAKIAARASGFIYCVTVTGITGTVQDVTNDIGRLAKEVKGYSSLPAVQFWYSHTGAG
ncbi:hypothetical protein N752_27685 [Desulforamulus aquiferis]|nr:hypothetical protein N752_27685 [Desulforamulus aquiferis]